MKRIVNQWIKVEESLDAYKGWLTTYDLTAIVLINEDAENIGRGVVSELYQQHWDVEVWNLENDDLIVLARNATYKEAMREIRKWRESHNVSLFYSDNDLKDYWNGFGDDEWLTLPSEQDAMEFLNYVRK